MLSFGNFIENLSSITASNFLEKAFLRFVCFQITLFLGASNFTYLTLMLVF